MRFSDLINFRELNTGKKLEVKLADKSIKKVSYLPEVSEFKKKQEGKEIIPENDYDIQEVGLELPRKKIKRPSIKHPGKGLESTRIKDKE